MQILKYLGFLPAKKFNIFFICSKNYFAQYHLCFFTVDFQNSDYGDTRTSATSKYKMVKSIMHLAREQSLKFRLCKRAAWNVFSFPFVWIIQFTSHAQKDGIKLQSGPITVSPIKFFHRLLEVARLEVVIGFIQPSHF